MQCYPDSETSSSDDDTLPVWPVQGPKIIDQYYLASKKRKEAQKEVERKKKKVAPKEVPSTEVKTELSVPEKDPNFPLDCKLVYLQHVTLYLCSSFV